MKTIFSIFLLCAAACRLAAGDGAALVARSGVKGGLVVHLGRGSGHLTKELRVDRGFVVQELDADPAAVEESRRAIQSEGLYGKITVDSFDGKRLPYADNLVNLIVVEPGVDLPKEEIDRALAPLGVALWLDGAGNVESEYRKPWPEKMDEWTHYLHGPANNAVALDDGIGLPRSPRWFGGPKWNRSHEELASVSAMVSAKGRLFYIIDKAPLASIRFDSDWRIVARDAFNGAPLWSRHIGSWIDHMRHFRTGPAHLPKRLTAVGDRVYVTLGLDAPVSALDAATGKTIKTYEGTEGTEEITFYDGALYLLVGPSEYKRFGEGLFDRGEPKPKSERFLVALDAESGKELWRRPAGGGDFILPLGVALANGRLFFHSVKGLGCLDPKTGKELWLVKRGTYAKRYAYATSTLVATDDAVLLADREMDPQREKRYGVADSWINWGVHGWNLADFAKSDRSMKTELSAYDAATGRELWRAPCQEGYNSPTDVFVINGLVWPGPFSKKERMAKAYDLKTGKTAREVPATGAPVGMAHHRCYRDKATIKYILAGRDGIEFIDLEKGWIRNNSWVRGACQYGIMPCNGLIYAPPDPCACHLKTRLTGFVALSSDKLDSVGKPIAEEGRLVKGPAYGRPAENADPSPWPAYRRTPDRSGAADAEISKLGKLLWTADAGKDITQATYGAGKVFVSSKSECVVRAFDAETGKLAWSKTVGGRVDTPPTFHKGKLLFGSADGWIYCLDASSGELAWKFMAAPERRNICVDGEVESSWPVHGSVLALDGAAYATAGRNTYIDGGIYFYKLDIETGKLLSWNVFSNIDPKTEKQTGPPERKFDSDGADSDILSSDGESIFMNYMRLDKSGKRLDPTIKHLFSPTGLVNGEKWFVRTYWTIAADVEGAGYGGWQKTSVDNPSGRILCFDGENVYGYGRKTLAGGRAGHRCDDYVLFAMRREPGSAETADTKKKPRGLLRKNNRRKNFIWALKFPLIVRAIAATRGTIVVAGPPDLGKKNPKGAEPLAFENPKKALEAFEGDLGACIQLVSAKDGAKIDEAKLDAPPVFDGISIADGKIFVSLKNGKIACFEIF